MLELAGQPLLDKGELIGGCLRLAPRLDALRLAAEVSALPASLWGNSGGRIGVHLASESIFLRGFAPALGNQPIEDREALGFLPYTKAIVHSLVPASPQRCLLARLPGGGIIYPHIDRAPYFSQTVRLHMAVMSHEKVFMYCSGSSYTMKPGEMWALNNSSLHGVLNADEARQRTHLICDFLPSAGLYSWLAGGERDLGRVDLEVETRLRLRSLSIA